MKAFWLLNEKIFISFWWGLGFIFNGILALYIACFTGKDEGQFLRFQPRQLYRHQGSPHQFFLVWSCLRLLCWPLPPRKPSCLCRQKSRLTRKRRPFLAHFPSFSFQRVAVHQTSHRQVFRSQFRQQAPYSLHSCKFRSAPNFWAFARRLGWWNEPHFLPILPRQGTDLRAQ